MAMLINFAAFQIGWFSAVIGAANGLPWVGLLVIAAVLALHFYLADRPFAEISLVLACTALGTWFDSMLVAFGWVAYESGQWHAMFAPYWIIAMWMLFATTLNVSLTWLRGRMWLGVVVGAIAGPLTYIAGNKLGAIEFLNQDAAIAALGIGWAVMLPALVVLGTRFDGFARKPAEVTVR